MEPKTLKASKFIPLVCLLFLPGIAYDFSREAKVLMAISLSASPLWYIFHSIMALFDLWIGYVVIVPALYTLIRWQHGALVTDEGIRDLVPTASNAIVRWSDVGELKRVALFGGIDISDTGGAVRLRMPFSNDSFGQLAQVLGEKLSGVDIKGALPVVFSPQPSSWFLLLSYLASTGCLFVSYAAWLDRSYFIVAFAIIPALFFCALPQLAKGIRVDVTNDHVDIRAPFSASKLVRFADIANIQLETLRGYIFVRLTLSNRRSVTIPDSGRNGVRIYRVLSSAWKSWKKASVLHPAN